MRWVPFFFLFLLCPLLVVAQSNQKPRIVGQSDLTIEEDQSITILMHYLRVVDPDDWFYPWGFSLQIYPGANYSVQGNVVTPAENFYGLLRVSVTVNDGTDESDKYNLEITVHPVNDRPVITGHTTSLAVREGGSLAIQLSHLRVTDPDNDYPGDFTLRVLNGPRYDVQGNTITPRGRFSGTLQVNVRVRDGDLESATYALPVEVQAVDRKPRIVGQSTIQTPEDEPFTIRPEHLVVEDDDSDWPNGFSLQVAGGTHYRVEGNTLLPDSNYFGDLVVLVRVNDGDNTSEPFDLRVIVLPVNDPPLIDNLETQPLAAGTPGGQVSLTETLTIREVDGDSIMFAEIGIRAPGYQPAADRLVYPATGEAGLRAVFDAERGTLTVLGQASPERYTRALRTIYYESLFPVADGERIVYFLANDGQSESDAAERVLHFGAGNVNLEIPTAFTPNGDTANDTWRITPLHTEDSHAQAHIRVYNRHGVVVFETIGFDHEWDGRFNGELLPADTYFYTIDLNLNPPAGFLSGSVTILR